MNVKQMIALGRKLGKQNDYHWFDEDTMRVWDTKIIKGPYQTHENIYLFVDSSTYCERTKYSVREFDSRTGRVETLLSDDDISLVDINYHMRIEGF